MTKGQDTLIRGSPLVDDRRVRPRYPPHPPVSRPVETRFSPEKQKTDGRKEPTWQTTTRSNRGVREYWVRRARDAWGDERTTRGGFYRYRRRSTARARVGTDGRSGSFRAFGLGRVSRARSRSRSRSRVSGKSESDASTTGDDVRGCDERRC
jgi:hypothetical protein